MHKHPLGFLLPLALALASCSDPLDEVLELKDCKNETEYVVNSEQFRRIGKLGEEHLMALSRYLTTHCPSKSFARKVMALPSEITVGRAIAEGKLGNELGFWVTTPDKLSPPIDYASRDRLRKLLDLPAEDSRTKGTKDYWSWDLRFHSFQGSIKGEAVFLDEFGVELFRSEIYFRKELGDFREHLYVRVPPDIVGQLSQAKLTDMGVCFLPGMRVMRAGDVEITTTFPVCSQ